MTITGLNYIGKQTSGVGVSSFSALDPVTGKSLPIKFKEATESEINTACLLAEKAFLPFSAKSNEEKAQFLECIGDEIIALGNQLLDVCHSETALPLGRLTGERGRTVNQLRLFAQMVREGSWIGARIDLANPNRTPIPKPDVRQIHVPIGPVGVFGASNFPLAFSVAGGDTASALAAGCPVVVKAHPMHPGTSELIAQAIISAAEKSKMPDGVFSLLQGMSNGVGLAIVDHPYITAIGFTGSFNGGKAIFDAANKREVPIPVFAEMGSANPVFILPEALKRRNEEIAKGLNFSLNLGVGQFCTNPGLIITNGSEFSEKLLLQIKDGFHNTYPGIMLGKNIKSNYEKGVEKLVANEGVELVGSSLKSEGTSAVYSNLFSTSATTFLQNKYLSEEVFGPTTLSIVADNENEMIEVARKLEGHLTATIIGTEEELKEHQELIQILTRKVGRLIFNGYPTGVEVCHSMVHGGPFPATTASQSTSVGTAAILRFSRPICYQDFPQELLPLALQNNNPLGIWRLIDGDWEKGPV